MIAEAIIVGVTSIVLGSLWLADRVHKREAQKDEESQERERVPNPIAERRRLLERQRATWLEAAKNVPDHQRQDRVAYMNAVARADQELHQPHGKTMRGLTSDEREALELANASAGGEMPLDRVPELTPHDERVHESLVARGLMSKTARWEEDELYWWELVSYEITDLGVLALRLDRVIRAA